MSNPYRSGTADDWYSGDKADLWVEYKFLILPKTEKTVIDLVSTGEIISPLQRSWLRDRAIEGRNVCVIVGCKAGGVVFEKRSWERPLTCGAFRAKIQTRASLAGFIVSRTLR